MFAPLLDAQPPRVTEDLRWVARDLGRVRDVDVLLKRLDDRGGELFPELQPVKDVLESRRDAARGGLRQALSSEGYVAFLDSLLKYVDQPGFTPTADRFAASVIPGLVSHTYSGLAEAVDALRGNESDENYHEVRIHAKRTRYAAEAAAMCLQKQARKGAVRMARLSEDVQNILGDRQDATVMRKLLLDTIAQDDRGSLVCLATGRLFEREIQSTRANESLFWETWTELRRKKNREWLNG
jgi:CHAD domain-containing protein